MSLGRKSILCFPARGQIKVSISKGRILKFIHGGLLNLHCVIIHKFYKVFPDTLTHLILKVDEGDMNICFIERKSSLKEFEVCSKSPNQHRSGLSPKIAIFGFLSCLLCSPHYWDRERWIRGELSKDPGTPEQVADQHGITDELERGT